MRFLKVIPALALLLAGCVSTSNVTDLHYATSRELDALAVSTATYFVDPSALQVAKGTKVGTVIRNGERVKVACIAANAKNRMGGYVGYKWYAFYMQMNEVPLDATDTGTAVCDQLG